MANTKNSKVKPLPTYEELLVKVNNEIFDKCNSLNTDAMLASVIAEFERNKKDLIWKILGLDNKWGGNWEVDHCNGRESPIIKYLEENIGEQIRAWIKDEVSKEISSVNKEEEIKKAIKKEIKEKYEYFIRTTVNYLTVGDQVKLITTELMEEMKKEFKEHIKTSMGWKQDENK